MLAPSLFDEEFLGLRCFRLTPPVTADDLDALGDLRGEGPLFADVKLPAEDMASARQLRLSGFRKVCTQVQFYHDLAESNRVGNSRSRGDAAIVDQLSLPAAQILAHAANFAASRYRQDTRLAPDRATALYARWVENSTSGARRVVHIDDDFCTFRDRGDVRQIDLVSVLDQRRGRGDRLMRTLLADARTAGLKRAQVVTEAENVAAMRLYLRSGYRIESAHSCFHLLHE